jgi:replicative DNA helicase
VIDMAGELAKKAYDTSIPLDITGELDELRDARPHSNGVVPLADIASGLYDDIGKTDADVVQTGFHRLDAAGIVRRQESMGVAARPSMGKSQLVFQWADGCVRSGGVALIWSGEMSGMHVGERILGARSGVAFREANEAEKVSRISDALGDMLQVHGLYVIDHRMTSMDLWSAAQKLRQREGRLDMVVVDHIRLMSDKNNEERHRLGAITKNLRDMGKDLDCAVIQAIQLNRGPEMRKDKRPGLGDLRDSGEIEENLDVAAFIYRDGYYSTVETGGSQSGKAELYAKKNRNGKLWGAGLWFDAEHGPRFREMV